MTTTRKVLVELESGHYVPVDPDDVYYLEAEDEDTWVPLAAAERLRVRRPLGEVATTFEPHGFLRIHRNHVVNLDRVREIRRRDDRRDWEVRLDPPVNRVLPVSRDSFDELLAAYGG